MPEKAKNAFVTLNSLAPLLQLLTVTAAILFFIFSLSRDITDLKDEVLSQGLCSASEFRDVKSKVEDVKERVRGVNIKVTTANNEFVRNKEDHLLIANRLNDIVGYQRDTTRVLDKLVIVMENVNDTMKRRN